jgi:hypothetical protein
MSFKCDRCGEETIPGPMLHIDLWAAVSEGRIDDVMCEKCIKERLGREPTAHDQRQPWWPKDYVPRLEPL